MDPDSLTFGKEKLGNFIVFDRRKKVKKKNRDKMKENKIGERWKENDFQHKKLDDWDSSCV